MLVDEDVGRTDVAVDDGVAVQVAGHPQQLAPEWHYLLEVKPALFGKDGLEVSKIWSGVPSGAILEEEVKVLLSFRAAFQFEYAFVGESFKESDLVFECECK
jgi:hypothetical protein